MREAHILAIDDDSAQRASYRRILRRSGYRLSCASNGKDGLHLVMDDRPDLILLDVSMPGMCGHEFLRRIRRLEARVMPDTGGPSATYVAPPVILVSARTRVHERVDGLDAGAADYITKPFDADDLRARVRRLLRDQARHSGLKLALA